ncbi:hypothetical protein KIN20_023160 [Parelaphostrongylus tenuis]|uniref:Uncharacterized protein n=1 Tax=Parelaphostrongylus tenuis TaxID=148309 RepID=A0AAD5MR78_PARTN|nr:hypothetical protein KIN20_023160 [Parelaphostrongylus tenuis]
MTYTIHLHTRFQRLHYPRSTRKSSKNELHDAEVRVTDDESLTKYKATLLGSSPTSVIVDENNPNIVIMKSITLQVDGCEEIKMDLAKHGASQEMTFVLKVGCQYRLRFDFYIQREIVIGLKYIRKVSRHGLQILKETLMIGSYGPEKELRSYTTPTEEALSGLLYRGQYKIASKITDDDERDWLKWTNVMNTVKDR